ncbi:MAG: DUF3375 domain-containing protein [Candidatus Sericytochromatia bacterium]
MQLEKIDFLIENSISIKLLRLKNAPIILSFVYEHFKENNIISISSIELIYKLADYLETINFKDSSFKKKESYHVRAKKYLDDWTEIGLLRKYPNDVGDSLFELTSATERVIQWIQSLDKKDFIGTESRFKDIFNKIREITENSTEDYNLKIKELEQKKKDIEEEIRILKKTKVVKSFDDFQVRSRFIDINRMSRDLLSDFKEVEDNFKDITRRLYEKHSQRTLSKGGILKYTFDSLDELKETDQGKSFYSFWNFLIDDNAQDELKELIIKLYEVLDERNIIYEDKFLKKIKTFLHLSGRKVLESNDLLAEKLTKIIIEKDIIESKKVFETISDIKNLAIKLVKEKRTDEPYIFIEGLPEIEMKMERKLGEEIIKNDFREQPKEFLFNLQEEANLDKLFNQNYVNKNQLIKNINIALNDRRQITLKELLEIFPLEKGLSELLSYISLTSYHSKFFLNNEIYEIIPFDFDNNRALKMPQIIFTK